MPYTLIIKEYEENNMKKRVSVIHMTTLFSNIYTYAVLKVVIELSLLDKTTTKSRYLVVVSCWPNVT